MKLPLQKDWNRLGCTKPLVHWAPFWLMKLKIAHFSGQLVLAPENSFSERIFSGTESKPALAQFEAISSCPVACYLEKRPIHTMLKPPFRELLRVKRLWWWLGFSHYRAKFHLTERHLSVRKALPNPNRLSSAFICCLLEDVYDLQTYQPCLSVLHGGTK